MHIVVKHPPHIYVTLGTLFFSITATNGLRNLKKTLNWYNYRLLSGLLDVKLYQTNMGVNPMYQRYKWHQLPSGTS